MTARSANTAEVSSVMCSTPFGIKDDGTMPDTILHGIRE
ncbi:hypothetical protein ACCUM_4316 [Candidatus Accumulibacter phosphatis]|uniref:Uncharacterized protein n=1 Tax=Candidatus Accumulibacter phosphatis TaxID=327160 RepID=A0A5S4EM98_9PROT|nr:hypothetical protein ACCUM_4316 [Candidatus Accumulibacter phosphatis]